MGNKSILKSVEGLKSNVVERGALDLTAAGLAVYFSTVLTSHWGWAKWIIRPVAGIGGLAVMELYQAIKLHIEKENLSAVLEGYLNEVENGGAGAAERFLNANVQEVVTELKDQITVMKNDLNGRQSEIAELSKLLAKAETVAVSLEKAEETVVGAEKKARSIMDDAEKKSAAITNKAEKKVGKLIESIRSINPSQPNTGTGTNS